MERLLRFIKHLIPKSLFRQAAPYYHLLLALLGALMYRFPGKHMIVIGVTGTKGKSSTVEYLNAIFEAAGFSTAIISTIRIKIGATSKPNKMRMTMPGRMFIQRTLRRALDASCTVAIIEMTSEGARQKRDRLLFMNALIFTNLSPEHIESHGSLDAYAAAKLSIARRLMHSPKRPRYIVANTDDAYGAKFLSTVTEHQLGFSLKETPHTTSITGGTFIFKGMEFSINFPGDFSIKNALAATTLTSAMGIPLETIRTALSGLTTIPGRAEDVAPGNEFPIIVDYAHTPDSLQALYDAYESKRRICVLGATGGGRDHWKRPLMGEIAENACEKVILTNEDPYDEDPREIVTQLQKNMKRTPEIIMDRREAIAHAISIAREGDVVLITGKGTDPSICGPRGTQEVWSDAEVAREELAHMRESRVV